jgi:hypothetical protein
MGVTAQITEHMLGAPERTFRVDHPVLSEQWSQPRSKDFRLSEELQVSVKVELAAEGWSGGVESAWDTAGAIPGRSDLRRDLLKRVEKF